MDDEPQIIQIGDVLIDTLGFAVWRDQKSIELTRREYDLLLYMFKNPNRPLSKQELLTQVWGGKLEVKPNTVEVYIRYLRVRLGKPGLIRTRRGFGYVLAGGV